LANSALKLATPAISRQILDSANGNLTSGDKTYISEQRVEAPRDWAPKKTGKPGVQSDDFGLHDDHHEDEPPVRPIEGEDHFTGNDKEKY
jgi:hypothetical protein